MSKKVEKRGEDTTGIGGCKKKAGEVFGTVVRLPSTLAYLGMASRIGVMPGASDYMCEWSPFDPEAQRRYGVGLPSGYAQEQLARATDIRDETKTDLVLDTVQTMLSAREKQTDGANLEEDEIARTIAFQVTMSWSQAMQNGNTPHSAARSLDCLVREQVHLESEKIQQGIAQKGLEVLSDILVGQVEKKMADYASKNGIVAFHISPTVAAMVAAYPHIDFGIWGWLKFALLRNGSGGKGVYIRLEWNDDGIRVLPPGNIDNKLEKFQVEADSSPPAVYALSDTGPGKAIFRRIAGTMKTEKIELGTLNISATGREKDEIDGLPYIGVFDESQVAGNFPGFMEECISEAIRLKARLQQASTRRSADLNDSEVKNIVQRALQNAVLNSPRRRIFEQLAYAKIQEYLDRDHADIAIKFAEIRRRKSKK